jgi:hypothetical protein
LKYLFSCFLVKHNPKTILTARHHLACYRLN